MLDEDVQQSTDQSPLLAQPAELDTLPPPIQRVALTGLNRRQGRQLYDYALEGARKARTEVEELRRTIGWEAERANRYTSRSTRNIR